MRKPSEYVSSAIVRLRGNLMPDSRMTMTHGDHTAEVTRVGALRFGEDSLNGDAPSEDIRVLALSHDYGDITKGDLVRLGESYRIVTSATEDVSGAAKTIGLSEAMGKIGGILTGLRINRRIQVAVDLLANRGGMVRDLGDGYGIANVYSWTLIVHKSDWSEPTGPEIGDEVRFEKWGDQLVRLTRVTDKGDYWSCEARTRQ